MTENGDKIAAWADSCAIFFVRVLCLPENKDCRRLGVEKWIQTKCRQPYIFRIHNLGGIHRESLSLRLSMSGHLYGSAARNEYVEW